ncbi:MAG TPA: hypothetical protein VFZ66_29720 [Herpetosiphonaceae bacterium]
MSQPKERPILFSGPMVRAILAGTKVQTRRVIAPQPEVWNEERLHGSPLLFAWKDKVNTPANIAPYCMKRFCPYGEPGDRLWVRETFCIESNFNIDSDYQPPFDDGRPVKWTESTEYGDYWQQCHYRATDPTPELVGEDEDDPGCRWRPSIHMPRWASRITLEITEIRVQRVRDISGKDALAEGVTLPEMANGPADPTAEFAALWDSINEARGYSWASNPWVWCISFKRIVQAEQSTAQPARKAA